MNNTPRFAGFSFPTPPDPSGFEIWMLGVAITLVAVAALAGCAGWFAKAVAFEKTPQGQAIVADVTSTALNAGVDALTGNDAGAILAGVQGGAVLLRTLETTPASSSVSAIETAISQGANVPVVKALVAPAVAAAVAKAEKLGIPATVAVEAAAAGLDAVEGASAAP
jgi:hypothetical protein